MDRIFTLAALLVAVSSCASHSLLIKSDDATFQEAQKRLEHTSAQVDASTASKNEKSFFMQAEAINQYRFDFKSRGGMAFFAEAAAAITDFPAFQSLAGSFDLMDLRVRAADASVQLWETFLLRYPKTPLRSLTLYHLGWAYRSTSASGLPRESSDDAFDALIHDEPNSDLAKFSIQAKATPWKSKDSAATRSLLPGLGQLYVGETESGIIRLAVAALAATAIAIPAYVAYRRDNLSWSHDWPLLALGVGGLVVLSFDYTSSYEDAMRGVVQYNERIENDFNRTHPNAP
jgi:hypothetical protein